MKRHLIQRLDSKQFETSTESIDSMPNAGDKTFRKTLKRPQQKGKEFYSFQKGQSQYDSKETSNYDDLLLDKTLKSSFQTEDKILGDFTFYKQQNQPNKITFQSTITFQNHNLETVIIYALLFNHLHLSQLKPRITSVTSRSLEIYTILKRHLLAYDDFAQQMGEQDYLFPSIAFRLLECSQVDVTCRRQHLKQIIGNMNSCILLLIFQNIVDQLQQVKNRKDFNKKGRGGAKIKMEKVRRIALFAEEIGINVRMLSQKREICFGKQQSPIGVSIVIKVGERAFSLKKIACYQQLY